MKTKRFVGTLVTGFLGGITGILLIYFFMHGFDRNIRENEDTSGSIAAVQNVRYVNLPEKGALASAVESQFNTAAETGVKAVVHVKTETEVETYAANPFYYFFFGDQGMPPKRAILGFGSGVILSPDGYIVTNYHVIEDAHRIQVTLDDKRTFKAELVGVDPPTDLALLKIKANNLPYLKFGDVEQVRLGDWVLAIGNPFNLTSTVTAGIISAKGRNLGIMGNKEYKIESYLQTDAALNPGNSGGALVNLKGELIGVNSAIISPTGGYTGYSFAIPADIVKKVVEDLEKYGQVQRAYLGVQVLDVDAQVAKEKHLDKIEGVYVEGLIPGGAAEAAGIHKGDVLLAINGKNINSLAELKEELSLYRPNDKVNVLVKRNGKTKQILVTLRNSQGSTELIKATGYVDGARFEPLTRRERERLRIDYGVRVVDIKPGKFMDIGIRKGYIILSINGEEVRTPEDVARILAGNGERIRAIEGIQSDGTYFSYEFRG